MSPNNINWSEFILKIEDTTAITPSLTFVLFLDHTEGHLILDFYQRARTALGNLLTHYSKGNGKRSRLNARAETMVPTWCKTLKPWPSMNYYIEFCGCDINQGVRAAELKFTIYHRPPEQEQLTPERVTQIKNHWQNWFAKSVIDSVLPASCLKITFPLEHEQAEPVTLLNWILDLELVKNWRFLSGYAGYSLNYFGETAHYAIRKPMFKRVASLFLRYPGLEVQGSSVYTDLLRYDPQWMDKTLSFIPLIKRVNWLTLISADAIEYLGGHNPLQSALTEHADIKLYPLKHGLMIQAGQSPQIGDLGHRDFIPSYRHVAKILRPIRLEQVEGLVEWGEDIENEWLNAFDKAYPA